MTNKTIQFGNEGEELVPGKTENLSSSLHGEGDAAKPDAFIGKQAEERADPRFDKRSADLLEDDRADQE